MMLTDVGAPLRLRELADPQPGPGQLRIRVEACGVCRTDLHVIDGELPAVALPIVPGHEIVGRVEAVGAGSDGFVVGDRVGVPWLAHSCGTCRYCRAERENLCDRPAFTGYTRPGGFATHMLAEAAFCLHLPSDADALATAPLLCAGLIGWRALRAAGDAATLGLYGFGAAAHIVAQLARTQGRQVFAFTRPGDVQAQTFARSLGAWAGDSSAAPPVLLDAAILFAPVGELVPRALEAVIKGGRVVCAGIHMSDIPSFPYARLWGERELVSVANLTRRDGVDFLAVAARLPIAVTTTRYRLVEANQALGDLRVGRLVGAAVLVP
jgi:propanol-preferring alcohol dehydrogenase